MIEVFWSKETCCSKQRSKKVLNCCVIRCPLQWTLGLSEFPDENYECEVIVLHCSQWSFRVCEILQEVGEPRKALLPYNVFNILV